MLRMWEISSKSCRSAMVLKVEVSLPITITASKTIHSSSITLTTHFNCQSVWFLPHDCRHCGWRQQFPPLTPITCLCDAVCNWKSGPFFTVTCPASFSTPLSFLPISSSMQHWCWQIVSSHDIATPLRFLFLYFIQKSFFQISSNNGCSDSEFLPADSLHSSIGCHFRGWWCL